MKENEKKREVKKCQKYKCFQGQSFMASRNSLMRWQPTANWVEWGKGEDISKTKLAKLLGATEHDKLCLLRES